MLMSAARRATPAGALAIAAAGAIALTVALGLGRFAYTPLLPVMLQEDTLDLALGGWLATANYAGYLAGALASMAIPRAWTNVAQIRACLLAITALTFAMAIPAPMLWLLLRFLAGIASALALVATAAWCLGRLAELGTPAMGSIMFAGPGLGIVLSGATVAAMETAGWPAGLDWAGFGIMAGLLTLAIWNTLVEKVTVHGAPHSLAPPLPSPPRGIWESGMWERGILAFAYGLAGFGYIVTATFLPVVADALIPGSTIRALLWPLFGLCVMAGAALAMRVPVRIDARLSLAACHCAQALGVAMPILHPTPLGFIVGCVLVGLPFTAITYFAVQEARRLHPHRPTVFIGLLTTIYGMGQIAGPAIVALMAHRDETAGADFSFSLAIAAFSLIVGAGLYLLLKVLHPLADRSPAP